MNTIPRLPMRFRQGEVLTADKLNALLDWMEAVQKLLPGLQVSTGPDLTFTRSGTGTVISLARGFAQRRGNAASDYEHPFKIHAKWEEDAVRVNIRGNVYTPREGQGDYGGGSNMNTASTVAFGGLLSKSDEFWFYLRVMYSRSPFPQKDESEPPEHFECTEAGEAQRELREKYNRLVECIRRLVPFMSGGKEIVCCDSSASPVPQIEDAKNRMWTIIPIGSLKIDIEKKTFKVNQSYKLRSDLIIPPCVYPTAADGSVET